MDEGARYRELVETPEYTAQLDALVERFSIEILESALMGVLWGVATNPEVYDRGTWNIRRAKSRSFDALFQSFPSFVILFTITDQNTVTLLWIEEVTAISEAMDL